MTSKVVSFGVGTAVLFIVCSAFIGLSMICAASLIVSRPLNVNVDQPSAVHPHKRPGSSGNTGAIGSMSEAIMETSVDPLSDEAEAMYGKLNSSALHETKEGPLANMIRNIRSRNSCGGNQWSQSRVQYAQSSRACSPSYQRGYQQYPSCSQSGACYTTGGSQYLSCSGGECVVVSPVVRPTPTVPVLPKPANTPQVDLVPVVPSIPSPDIQSTTSQNGLPFLPDASSGLPWLPDTYVRN